jgi:CDP-diacylglycerol--glycerol-3-phosphate 3-phosphatidyltransferase
MVSSSFKPAVSRVIEPIARTLSRIGVTPDAVTIFGTIGATLSALIFFSNGDLFLGTILVLVFSLSDMFDGAIARISERGPSKWGAFLDSTCDRITDSSLLMGLAIYLIKEENPLIYVAILSLVAGNLIPYIRAKAESLNISCTVGIAERTERLGIALLAIGLAGLNVPFALAIGMWVLAIASTVTVLQRILVVRKGLLGR